MKQRPAEAGSGATGSAGWNDFELSRLLSRRIEDGLVYLSEDTDGRMLEASIKRGLVSADGQITTAGYRLCLRNTFD